MSTKIAINAAQNQNRSRIVFWNILSIFFACLALLTLIRLGFDTVSMVITAVLGVMALLCLLARRSVTAQVKPKAQKRGRTHRPTYELEDDEEFQRTNLAAGLTLIGTGGGLHSSDNDNYAHQPHHEPHSHWDETRYNPATGLPIVGGGGIDVAGNPYGIDNNDTHHHIDDHRLDDHIHENHDFFDDHRFDDHHHILE